ncbi:ATP-dependent RNA helicase ROK1 [Dipodascopsis uninucleata]
MDFFRLLSRGTKLDDTSAFSKAPVKSSEKNDSLLAREIQFFHAKTASKQKFDRSKDVLGEDDVKKPSNIRERNILDSAETKAVSSYRKATKTKITGDDVPLSLLSFDDLVTRFRISRFLQKNISRENYSSPTPIQSEAIPALIQGRDVIACAPTGSGKTIAYSLPLVHKLASDSDLGEFRGLILVPTKELAIQVCDQLQRLTLKTSLKVKVLSKAVIAQSHLDRASRPRYDILVATPLRLVHALKQEDCAISLSKVQILILDEADRLLEEGFLEQVDMILSQFDSIARVQKGVFSATIPSGVETLVSNIMNSPLRIIIGRNNAANENVEQRLIYAGSEEGKLIAVRQMAKTGELQPPVLIFLQSVERANALFHELLYDGVNVEIIHGERTEAQRNRIIEKFKLAEIWVLICTDVLARGIDVHGVNLVINYDVPQSSQAYIHRIGRTGRAGRKGRAITLYTKDDTDLVHNVISVMKESGCELQEWMKNLAKLSKQKKKELKRKPVDRADISTKPKKRKNLPSTAIDLRPGTD